MSDSGRIRLPGNSWVIRAQPAGERENIVAAALQIFLVTNKIFKTFHSSDPQP